MSQNKSPFQGASAPPPPQQHQQYHQYNQYQQHQQHQQHQQPMFGAPSEYPPSYEQAMTVAGKAPSAYPPQAPVHQGYYPAMGPTAGVKPVPPPPPHPLGAGPLLYPAQQNPVNVTVNVPEAQFDAAARFKPYSPPGVPPPPPGVAPNSAQLMAMGMPVAGASTQIRKKKGGFFNGSGSGGYTFW